LSSLQRSRHRGPPPGEAASGCGPRSLKDCEWCSPTGSSHPSRSRPRLGPWPGPCRALWSSSTSRVTFSCRQPSSCWPSRRAEWVRSLVPDQLLGRANATWRFLVFGAQPLGALLGGAIGATVGLRTALVVGSVGILLAVAWATRSPLRSLRQIPA